MAAKVEPSLAAPPGNEFNSTSSRHVGAGPQLLQLLWQGDQPLGYAGGIAVRAPVAGLATANAVATDPPADARHRPTPAVFGPDYSGSTSV